VNDINYIGDNNNYNYLKNRVLRFKNKRTPEHYNKKEEHKDNFDDYNYDNDEQFNDNNLYLNTEYNKKRKANLKNENQHTNYSDETERKKRLERQKKKLKEELWGKKVDKFTKSKIDNNNPINRKDKEIYNNYHDEFFDEDNTKKQKIKIVRKNQNNKNKENSRKHNLLNKKEKYEKNLNDQSIKYNNINDDKDTNKDFTNELKSTISVNTEIKNDPLYFITHYYLAKDKLNKITNHKKSIEEEKYNKSENVNFFEILKLLNETKKNNPEKRLRKFRGKQSPLKRITHHYNNNSNLSNQISYNIETKQNNDYSPLKTSYNHNFQTNQSIPGYYRNHIFSITESNHFKNYNNETSIRKKSHNTKRKKRLNSVDNTEKRLNSCKRMCKVCNKAHKEKIDIEKCSALSELNIRNYSDKSNSIKKKIRK